MLLVGDSLERWHAECLDRLEGAGGRIEAVLTVPCRQPPPLPSAALRWYARRSEVGARSRLSPDERLAAVPRRDVAAAAGRAPEWDVVLKLGAGPVPAGLDGAARLGVWCFAHELDGAVLPFFDEVQRGEPVTRAALVALGGGQRRVLEEGYFRTARRSYVGGRDLILGAIAGWPARVCAADPADRQAGPDDAPRALPRLSLPRCAARIARNLGRLAWERLFRHPQWNIGLADLPAARLLDPGVDVEARIHWLPLQGRSSFLADPFGVERGGTLRVLCERFHYGESRGRLCALEWPSPRPEPALDLPVHASYPFLVDGESGETFCVPETAAAGEIALYRTDPQLRRWSKEGVIAPDFPGVDPTVFRHEGRWWLLATRQGPLEDVELWAWHAPSLLGPWSPHARNPVKSDVRGSRPAGRPFLHEGVLYRPAQDCSRSYGWRVAIQRVLRLTPTDFAEEEAAVVQAPARSPYPSGRHTLCAVGDRTLVDGRRDVFVPAALRAFLGIWARDLASRLGRHQKLSRSPRV